MILNIEVLEIIRVNCLERIENLYIFHINKPMYIVNFTFLTIANPL